MSYKGSEKHRQYQREYYQKNKGKKREQIKLSREENPEGVKASYKRYHQKHRERINNKKRVKAEENRRLWREFIIGAHLDTCTICGYNKCLSAIDYHHVVGNKKYLISDIMSMAFTPKNIQIFEDEIVKCVPLCANCHREIHDGN